MVSAPSLGVMVTPAPATNAVAMVSRMNSGSAATVMVFAPSLYVTVMPVPPLPRAVATASTAFSSPIAQVGAGLVK